MDQATTSSDNSHTYESQISAQQTELASVESYSIWNNRNSDGIVFFLSKNYDEAISCHLENLSYARNVINDAEFEFHSCNNLGICFREQEKIDDALIYFLRSLDLAKNMNFNSLIHLSLYQLQKSYYQKSILIQDENNGQENDDSIIALTNAANFCLDLLINNTEISGYEISVYHNLATIYKRLKRYADAECIYLKMLNMPSIKRSNDMVLQVHVNLAETYFHLGQYSEALIYYEKSLSVISLLRRKSMRIPVYFNLFKIYHHYGDHSKAIYYIKFCLRLASIHHDRIYQAKAYKCLIDFYKSMEEWKEALKYAKLYLKLNNSVKNCHEFRYSVQEINYLRDKINQGVSSSRPNYAAEIPQIDKHSGILNSCWQKFNDIGDFYYNNREYDKALIIFNLNLNRSREFNDLLAEACDFHNIGKIYCAIDDFDKAIENFQSGLLNGNYLGHSLVQEMSIYFIGYTYFLKARKLRNDSQINEEEEIRRTSQLAAYYLEKIVETSGNNLRLFNVYNLLGEIFYTLGNYNRSLIYYKNELKIAKLVGNQKLIMVTYKDIGDTYFALGDHIQAIENYELAKTHAARIGDQLSEAQICFELAKAFFCCGRFNESILKLKFYLMLTKSLNMKAEQANAFWSLCYVHYRLNRFSEAYKYGLKHYQLCNKINNLTGKEIARLNIDHIKSIIDK